VPVARPILWLSSELLVAAQRAMPSWARGRMNATVIMISQGAMALGGLIWGSAGAIAGTSHNLLGAAVLFLTSLLLARRLSINFAGNVEERVSGVLSIRIEPEEATLRLKALDSKTIASKPFCFSYVLRLKEL
jgi:Transmembrane secretion effector